MNAASYATTDGMTAKFTTKITTLASKVTDGFLGVAMTDAG